MKDGWGPITNREIGINLNTDVTSFKKMCLKTWHKSNLTTLYNESNARVRYFTPEEEPQLTQGTVLVDVDDESIIKAYENEHIHQEESEDLTSDFFTEIKGKPYTLKRK